MEFMEKNWSFKACFSISFNDTEQPLVWSWFWDDALLRTLPDAVWIMWFSSPAKRNTYYFWPSRAKYYSLCFFWTVLSLVSGIFSQACTDQYLVENLVQISEALSLYTYVCIWARSCELQSSDLPSLPAPFFQLREMAELHSCLPFLGLCIKNSL